ncbi:MAG: hypothetical protein ABFD94_16670 [Armatimonadia bacterium]
MTTSGTATFNMDLLEIVEEAYERCGVEVRSGYDLRTARRSLNLMFMEWASRGVNLWTVEQGSVPLVAGTATYTLPADTVDILEQTVRTGAGSSQADLTVPRISFPDYAVLSNKNVQGRPTQVYVNRQATAPTVTLYPVPDTNGPYTFVYWRMRRIQDATDGVNTMDVPFRFIPCVVAGLAYHLCLKVPSAADRLNVLREQYDTAWAQAAAEDRDRAPVRFVPRASRV